MNLCAKNSVGEDRWDYHSPLDRQNSMLSDEDEGLFGPFTYQCYMFWGRFSAILPIVPSFEAFLQFLLFFYKYLIFISVITVIKPIRRVLHLYQTLKRVLKTTSQVFIVLYDSLRFLVTE